MDNIDLRNEIKRRGYSVQNLAKQLKISDVTLYRKINGQYPFNEAELLFLANKLRIKPEDIASRTEAKEKKPAPEEKTIINNGMFKLTLTRRNPDDIAIIENLSNDKIKIKFNNEKLNPIVLNKRDWMGIRADVEGLEAVHELTHNNYEVKKVVIKNEYDITKFIEQYENMDY